MVLVESENQSGVEFDIEAASRVMLEVLLEEGIEEGWVGLTLVPPERIRLLKNDHLGIDEETDVLAFPIDGRDPLPEGTQRNMRIHFAIAVAVLVVAVAVRVSRLELIALLLSIAFVLVAEMINTAVEGTIDAATTSFDPMAKLAKDIAAGAVLIASVTAVAVGYLVFAGKAADKTADVLDRLRDAPAQITVIALVLTVIIVIATKAWNGKGKTLRRGLPSGHA